MLTKANLKENGDGTTTFEFQMCAEQTEVMVLKKLMSDYNNCIDILRKHFKAHIHRCDSCGKEALIGTIRTLDDGTIEGPYYLCQDCYLGKDGKQ